jgi:hypothetical protein
MIKWFAYIVLLLIMTPGLSSAKKRASSVALFYNVVPLPVYSNASIDTTSSKKTKQNQQDADDKKKIKEIAKARRQPKPEKIVPVDGAPEAKKQKPKRQRRPEGLEQPPEIPRRNDN